LDLHDSLVTRTIPFLSDTKLGRRMYFKDLLPSDADYEKYKKLLQQFSDFVRDCISFPLTAYKVAEQSSFGDGKLHHSPVLMLIRHFCEQSDAVAVLATEGCGEPAKPLIRSAFEASLSVQYIMEKDSERRGLAYLVAHTHRRIKLYRKLDPSEQAGKELRNKIQNDPMSVSVLKGLPVFDFQKLIARLTGMLARSPYDAIEREWTRRKKELKSEPSWYSLYDGPRTIQALALHLRKGGWYELLYSDWSDVVHAGSGMVNVAANTSGGDDPVVIRPLRHPEGLQNLIVLAAGLCLELTRCVLKSYGTDADQLKMQARYNAEIRDRYLQLTQGDLITAPWK
jgi:hypothetical protein